MGLDRTTLKVSSTMIAKEPTEAWPELSGQEFRQIDLICDDLEKAYRAGEAPGIEAFVARVEERLRLPLTIELIRLELEHAPAQGRKVCLEDYRQRFSLPAELMAELVKETGRDNDCRLSASTGDFVGEGTPDGIRETSDARSALSLPL